MKTVYFILITFIGMQLSCTTSDVNENSENTLIGKWQLIEWYSSEGAEGTWEIIDNGYFYQFNEDNTLESNLFNCNGSYSVEDNLEYNLLISFNCENNQFQGYHKIEYDGDYLLLWAEGCVVACIGKYKRFKEK
ncbi:MAG: hypothetical protein COW66_07725 [Flavobacteriaceae bacterium CG18_big_fil_WC_8_21_14_2_50_34_36]|nr:hypothetical protein [Flavobacteriia bacterium]PIQ18199.1 MAG: hypothetical protein COW66_07725 [Flavobacteriaceae bacterium CG18_big_fil_WC_8_21_14_2_50_34_36]PIV51322.1 MAG: hypothetical protein COS19_01960 [Flavobacteriaceae bacterium CG02_land_8_20_14_3_00_34_13]PIZ08548.1 MAG: hypothetical protein COY56_03220 [Flavobacteriaceae bacterium CG_4_10_14_0_8_um_filter_34_31]PJC07138.1 MAG: hypothetical protein CO068_07875 [Flavobacteriaceae bacterium CG_4_9_14_0_8_um_filter_34_30]